MARKRKRLQLSNDSKVELKGGANGNSDVVFETVKKSPGFFGEEWKRFWGGMPEFVQEQQKPFCKISLNFRNQEDLDRFAKLISQNLNRKSQSTWFPEIKFGEHMTRYVVEEGSKKKTNPQYPIYVISKGRWHRRLTSRELETMKVPYRIVVEPQEYKKYAKVIDPKKILTLPFSNLGQGSIPARNWVWEHSISEGYKSHWILDDNIESFNRVNRNAKPDVETGAIFRAAEDFVDRFENVGLSGFNYYMFCNVTSKQQPYRLNTRIYSCILIRNDLPFRWRGRYNEDTDLSIRVLKAGYSTVLFNAFLAKKVATMLMKGGNTDELYQGDGRRVMAESLQKQHPDIVGIRRRWNRWQHVVDYSRFKTNRLILKKGIVIPDGIDNYGMVLGKKPKRMPKI